MWSHMKISESYEKITSERTCEKELHDHDMKKKMWGGNNVKNNNACTCETCVWNIICVVTKKREFTWLFSAGRDCSSHWNGPDVWVEASTWLYRAPVKAGCLLGINIFFSFSFFVSVLKFCLLHKWGLVEEAEMDWKTEKKKVHTPETAEGLKVLLVQQIASLFCGWPYL